MAPKKPTIRPRSVPPALMPKPALTDADRDRFIGGRGDVTGRHGTSQDVTERRKAPAGTKAKRTFTTGREVRRTTVYLDAETFELLVDFCESQGATQGKVIERAVRDWVLRGGR